MVDFLEYVAGRRRQHPRLHIYHYASYERMHLVSIAAQHDVGEEAVDDLLRCGVLVDLHPIVKQSLRVGSRSYSLKKLEPLYLGTRGRSGVATAVDSITEYVRSRDLIDSGDTDAAARILAEIATCNEYDCISISRSMYRCTTLILSSRSSPPLWPGFRRGSAPLTNPPLLSPLPPSTITGARVRVFGGITTPGSSRCSRTGLTRVTSSSWTVQRFCGVGESRAEPERSPASSG